MKYVRYKGEVHRTWRSHKEGKVKFLHFADKGYEYRYGNFYPGIDLNDEYERVDGKWKKTGRQYQRVSSMVVPESECEYLTRSEIVRLGLKIQKNIDYFNWLIENNAEVYGAWETRRGCKFALKGLPALESITMLFQKGCKSVTVTERGDNYHFRVSI